MADIDLVLERLVTDTAFRAALTQDPAAALASYDLSASDVELLASSLDDGDDAQRSVEQRTSKSAMVGLLASLTGGGGQAQDLASKKGTTAPTRPFTAVGTYSDGRSSSPTGMTSDIPKLDGASKDAAHLSQDAPPDEELRKLPGRPKAGEITLTRSQVPDVDGDGEDARYGYEKWRPSPAREDLAPADQGRPNKDYATDPYVETAQRAPAGDTGHLPDDAADRIVDRPKAGEISVSRSQVPDTDAEGQDVRYYEKWRPSPGRENVAPPGQDAPLEESVRRVKAEMHVEDVRTAAPSSGPAESADHHWIKYQPSSSEAAPPTGDWDGDGTAGIKIEIGAAGQRAAAPAPDDFLTVEDE